MSFLKAVETPYAEGLIIVNKVAIEQCVKQLKEEPVKDIAAYVERIERITFAESMGKVKDQNIIVQDKAVESLRALLAIFNAFITTIESVTAAMQDTDASIANSLLRSPLTPVLPPGGAPLPPWTPSSP
jgi:hypothetical protein